MKLNRFFILCMVLLCLCSDTLKANENNLILDSANAAYAKADYEKAIKLYESIINKGQIAPELYFNLGNAYFKANINSYAILNYERAKKLAPNDEDILANLKLANTKTEDKIEAQPQLFLTGWKNGIVDMMSEKSWSILCIALVCAALLMFFIYVFTERKGLKQLGFFMGSFIFILSVIVFFIAKHKYNLTIASTEAVITSPTVTVMGSPNEKGTKLFVLHEGTKVTITEPESEWTEVKIANGNVGWVPTKTIVSI